MIEVLSCNLCSGKNFKSHWQISKNETGFPENIHLVTCRDCSLGFISPQPEPHELAPFYEVYALHTGSKKWKDLIYLFFARTFWQDNHSCSIFLKPFRVLCHFLRGIRIIPNAKVLDIGCGNGSFPRIMTKLGMSGHGIEPYGQPQSSEEPSSKTYIYHTDLASADFPDEYFDMITMNHVLEHLHDPLQELKEIHRILKKNGSLFIGVPNIQSILSAVFQAYSCLYDEPRHLFHFSFDVLRKYAELLKFMTVQERSIWNSFVYMDSILRFLKKNKVVKSLRLQPRCLGVLSFLSLPIDILAGYFGRGGCIEVEWKKI